ncbi:hypothetical protein K9M79_00140 [Candidatus Woesearchaeota archaeon]|nr:hypothetical protein [Candidatus Woesearchaeota archaeon]
MFKKRGYIFTLDAMIAITVLVVGFFLISGAIISSPQLVTTYDFSYSILSSFTTIKIKELYYSNIDQMIRDEKMTHTNNNVLQQMGEFYEADLEGNTEANANAWEFIDTLINATVPDEYGAMILVEGRNMYNSSEDYNTSNILISSKRIVFGQEDNGEVWGPYVAEVWLWK